MKNDQNISAKFILMTLLELFGFVYSRNVLLKMEEGDGFAVRNIREYFIAAEKVNWDYLPMGTNPLEGNNSYIDKFLRNGPDMIGSKYNKYVYKQYTNSSFTTEIPKPDWLGLLGPIIRGEVGEIIKVHFRNMADRELSMHPHGLRYNKNNEGAMYMDGTSAINKTDDTVLPGGTYTYVWKITERFAPTADDPNCIPWAYHSHVNPDRDVNAGLLGILLTCKEGVLTADGQRNDVDKEFVLYYDIIDENESWLINENVLRCKNVSACHNPMDEDIVENNRKYVINGYLFNNQPNLTACAGSRVAWHFFSLSESYHPVVIHGQTFAYRQHRASVIGIWPATFSSAMMTPLNPGNWIVTCFNTRHNARGMQSNFRVEQCSGYTVQEMLSGNQREYFLAVEEEVWDYAPTGQNQFDGGSLTNPARLSSKYFSTESGARIGRRYKKARYHSYTDAGFRTKSKIIEEERHLGILGQVIRAEVGDTIFINLKNNATRSYGIYLQGVSMEKRMEGTWEKENSQGEFHGHIILPGHVGTYNYTVPGYLAPTEDDPACLTYMYYSAVNVIRDIHSGLIGPLLICKPETLDPVTNKQKYIDKDVFLFYSSIDENLSWYIDDNIATYAPGKGNESDPDFIESNIMRSINGRAYGNLEGLKVCAGNRVAWHVFSFGESEGIHGATFLGNNVMISKVHRDSQLVMSGLSFTGLMHVQNLGRWGIICHNNNHFEKGMKALYNAEACGSSYTPYIPSSGTIRRYYIGAIETNWNYASITTNPLTGKNFSDANQFGNLFIRHDEKHIGTTYYKVQYSEFTDSSFTLVKKRKPEELHLGIMGPFIKAEVGDTIEVMFKNFATRDYSIHPQGLLYNKSNEGMIYNDGTDDGWGDGAVSPGQTYTYRWKVPPSSGPGENDPNCMGSIYHSGANPVRDTNSGLVGPLVICRKGVLTYDGQRKDHVRSEFALLFSVLDENRSWYLSKNKQKFAPLANEQDDTFMESNLKSAINGYLFGNIPNLNASVGENIAWYIMALGTDNDIHTAHFHGHTFIHRASRAHTGDVIEVFPGTYETVEVFADNPGTWLLHCHVGKHTREGMIALYTIE